MADFRAIVSLCCDPVQAYVGKADAGAEAIVVDDIEGEVLAPPAPVDGGDAAFDVSGLVGAGDDALPTGVGGDVVGDGEADAVVALFWAADEGVMVQEEVLDEGQCLLVAGECPVLSGDGDGGGGHGGGTAMDGAVAPHREPSWRAIGVAAQFAIGGSEEAVLGGADDALCEGQRLDGVLADSDDGLLLGQGAGIQGGEKVLCLGEQFLVSSEFVDVGGGEAAHVHAVFQAPEARQEFVYGGHGGGGFCQAAVGQRQGCALEGVEDVGGYYRSLEGGAEGEDASGVGCQVVVAAEGEGSVGDQSAHGVGDKHELGRPVVEGLAAGRLLGGVGEPVLQVVACFLSKASGIDGDGQSPVVGEGHDRVAVGSSVFGEVDELGVGLDAAKEGAPDGCLEEAAGLDAAVVADPFVGCEVKRCEAFAPQPCPGEPAGVRDPPDHLVSDGVVELAAHDSGDDDDRIVGDAVGQAGFGVRSCSGSDFPPRLVHGCHTSYMQHTGGEVRQKPLPEQGVDPSAQRLLLTLAVRDYPKDPNRERFAQGIDEQVKVVSDWWWQTPDPEMAFRPVEPEKELTNRDQVEDFLRKEKVREIRAEALVVFITAHGIAGASDTHFLRLPDTDEKRPLATAVRTVDVVAAALDSHAKNVLVIVNTCFAGNMNVDLAAAHKEIRPSRRDDCQLDVLVTCGLKTKIEVTKFPTLLRAALERLRTTAGITTPYLSVPEFMAQYALGLSPEDEKKFKLHHLVPGGTNQPSVCLPNPGYVRLPELAGALRGHTPWAAEYWLDRASGRPREKDTGWYFRGRESLNEAIARFLGPDTKRGVLLVTGCAGSGKSAVLARAVMLSDPKFRRDPLYKAAEEASAPGTIPPENARCAAVLARNLDAAQVAADLVKALGLALRPVGVTDDQVAVWSRQVLDHVQASDGPVTIVLDALDEAQEQARIISDVLGPLASFCGQPVPAQRQDQSGEDWHPGVRLLIGVRSSQPAAEPSTTAAEDDAGLLLALRRVFPASRVERTDSIASKEDMGLYLHALVADTVSPGSLAEVIPLVVDAVWPSFIDARLAGYQLRNASDPLTLARNEDWHRTTLTQGIRGLLRRDLRMVQDDGLPPPVALALLKASAYAKGQGVPWGEVWPAIAGVFLLPEKLEPEEWDGMIAKLLSGRLSGYLAQAIEDDRRVYRPAHEELAAELLRPDSDLLDFGGSDE